MSRIALGIAYRGTRYHGFQRQQRVDTVQQTLESALSKVADHPITVSCAGRTDAGVHATQQVVHFDTTAVRPDKAWVQGVNTHLPDDISVNWVRSVPESFDARRSATARHYQYLIYNHSQRFALGYEYAAREHRQLDAELMQLAASALIGEHDFSAFRAAHCQAKTPFRRLDSLRITKRADLIVIDATANAFLHHMVRNIVGALCDVGSGKHDPSWMAELLASRDRAQAGKMAPAAGLYLCQVDYPEAFGLPGGRSPADLIAFGRPA
ncbi:MAG: tRNA pseudouridine(38-40) synthase TruA [Proteobacteria bacterium]|jgi:tRNA pseudouridine38-40 synthase|nr:tRNA pseudouridine(38-40) synthase TruA [Pseudomonadota bacterium]